MAHAAADETTNALGITHALKDQRKKKPPSAATRPTGRTAGALPRPAAPSCCRIAAVFDHAVSQFGRALGDGLAGLLETVHSPAMNSLTSASHGGAGRGESRQDIATGSAA